MSPSVRALQVKTSKRVFGESGKHNVYWEYSNVNKDVDVECATEGLCCPTYTIRDLKHRRRMGRRRRVKLPEGWVEDVVHCVKT